MSRKSKSRKGRQGRPARTPQPKPENPYQAPGAAVAGPTASVPGVEARPGIFRLARLKDAFKVASKQQLTWIACLVVAGVLALVANLLAAFGLGILSGMVGVGLVSAGATSTTFDFVEIAVQGLYLLVFAAISSFFIGGLFHVATKQSSGQTISTGDLFAVTPVLGHLVLGSILTWLLAYGISFIFLIITVALSVVSGAGEILVPVGMGLSLIAAGIVFARLMLTFPVIVDSRQSAIQAIKTSWMATRGNTIKAVVFYVLAMVFSILGVILLGIGILLTMPIYYVAIALVYRDLVSSPPKTAPATP